MIYQALAVAALVAVVGVGGYFKGKRDEAVGWAVAVAKQNAEIQRIKDDSLAREKAAAQSAAKAIAQLAAAKTALEKERANAKTIHAEWAAYLDSLRASSDPAVNGDALAACRADEAAARGALDGILATAIEIRQIAALNTAQLLALQEWLREITQ